MEERKNVKEKYLKDYLIFGWQSMGVQEIKRGKKTRMMHVVTRQTTMNNYSLICEFEKQYFYICHKHREYKPINSALLICLFILGVIPGFIYLAVKVGSKSEIEKKNKEIEEQKAVIAAEVRELRRYKYVPDKPIF